MDVLEEAGAVRSEHLRLHFSAYFLTRYGRERLGSCATRVTNSERVTRATKANRSSQWALPRAFDATGTNLD
jgi:hypothetical protein